MAENFDGDESVHEIRKTEQRRILESQRYGIGWKRIPENLSEKVPTLSFDSMAHLDDEPGTNHILLKGENYKSGSFRVWSANADGIVQDSTTWKSTEEAVNIGWERLFGIDLNNDKTINSLDLTSKKGIALAFENSKPVFQTPRSKRPS